MSTLFLYTFAAFGLAYIVGHARVSLPVREYLAPTPDVRPPWGGFGTWLVSGMECVACMGFHIGFWTEMVMPTSGLLVEGSRPLSALALATYTTGANFILGKYTKLL